MFVYFIHTSMHKQQDLAQSIMTPFESGNTYCGRRPTLQYQITLPPFGWPSTVAGYVLAGMPAGRPGRYIIGKGEVTNLEPLGHSSYGDERRSSVGEAKNVLLANSKSKIRCFGQNCKTGSRNTSSAAKKSFDIQRHVKCWVFFKTYTKRWPLTLTAAGQSKVRNHSQYLIID